MAEANLMPIDKVVELFEKGCIRPCVECPCYGMKECKDQLYSEWYYLKQYQKLKKGEWIVHDYALGRERYECTECKGRCDLEYNFCPHCGADMRGNNE